MQKYRLILLPVIIIFLVIGSACKREVVSFRDKTPAEQFRYAKSFFDKKDYYKAKNQFTRVMLNNPGDPVIEEAQFYLAESYYHSNEYIIAVQEYNKLINSMPQSKFVDNAEYRIASAYYELSPKYSLDQEYTIKAINQFQLFLDTHPDSEFADKARSKLRECRNKLGIKEFKTGELYRKMGYPRAAMISFRSVIESYYDTDFVDDALFMLGDSHMVLGNMEDAEMAFMKLLEEFPGSSYTEKALDKLESIRKELSRYQIRK